MFAADFRNGTMPKNEVFGIPFYEDPTYTGIYIRASSERAPTRIGLDD